MDAWNIVHLQGVGKKNVIFGQKIRWNTNSGINIWLILEN